MAVWILAALMAGQLVDGHVHAAPHGGLIAHAGPYHIELLVTPKAIDVWVLNRHLTPVPLAAHALTLKVTEGSSAPQTPPSHVEAGHFRALIHLDGSHNVDVEIQLDKGVRARRAHYHWTPLDARDRIEDGPGPLEGLKL